MSSQNVDQEKEAGGESAPKAPARKWVQFEDDEKRKNSPESSSPSPKPSKSKEIWLTWVVSYSTFLLFKDLSLTSNNLDSGKLDCCKLCIAERG